MSNLTSKYAIRLYELLIAWREVGKTPQIELSEFRQKIGVENGEYERMHHFKARVLEPAIKQINEHTDITASYEQHKRGRTISGFSFRFKQKQQVKKIESKRDPNTPDFFIKMTDAQRHLFAKKCLKCPKCLAIHRVQKAISNLLFVLLTCFYNLKNSESYIQF